MDFIVIIVISLLSPYYSYFLLKTSLLPVSTNYKNTALQALNPKKNLGKLNYSKPKFYHHVDDRAAV
jgi:hypothetical protein